MLRALIPPRMLSPTLQAPLRVEGSRSKACGLGLRVQGAGLRVWGKKPLTPHPLIAM